MTQEKTGKAGKKTGILILSIFLIAGATAALFALVISRTKEDGYEYLIGLSQPDLADNAQLALYNDIEAACAEEDMRLVAFNAGHNTSRQVKDVRTLTEIGVDAIIIASENADAMADVISDAYHRGITVILIGSVPVNGDFTCNIVPNRYQAGRTAGEYAAELAGGKTCTVLEIQGEAKSRVSKELQRGFLDAVSGKKNISKEYVMTGYWRQADTQKRLNESHFFTKEPAIDLIFAHNDVMAVAAAAEAEEKESEAAVISVGGYDLRGSDLEAVKDGRLKAAVFCPTGGREAVQLAVRIIREKELPPETIYLEPVLVTAENVDEYLHAEEAEK